MEHTPSKFGHDPSPVRRGLVASVKCLCATSTFFSLSGPAVEQNKRSQSLVWVSTPQRGNLFCFLFIDPIILGRPLASQQRKLLFGVAVCACPRREPLVQSTRGHRRYSCAAAVIVCRIFPRRHVHISAAATLMLRGSYDHRCTMVSHNSDSSCPPSFVRHDAADVLGMNVMSRRPSPYITTTSAALLRLCSSDGLLQAHSMCVGFRATKYAYQYNRGSSLSHARSQCAEHSQLLAVRLVSILLATTPLTFWASLEPATGGRSGRRKKPPCNTNKWLKGRRYVCTYTF